VRTADSQRLHVIDMLEGAAAHPTSTEHRHPLIQLRISEAQVQ
jgi:hypothetical protein